MGTFSPILVAWSDLPEFSDMLFSLNNIFLYGSSQANQFKPRIWLRRTFPERDKLMLQNSSWLPLLFHHYSRTKRVQIHLSHRLLGLSRTAMCQLLLAAESAIPYSLGHPAQRGSTHKSPTSHSQSFGRPAFNTQPMMICLPSQLPSAKAGSWPSACHRTNLYFIYKPFSKRLKQTPPTDNSKQASSCCQSAPSSSRSKNKPDVGIKNWPEKMLPTSFHMRCLLPKP